MPRKAVGQRTQVSRLSRGLPQHGQPSRRDGPSDAQLNGAASLPQELPREQGRSQRGVDSSRQTEHGAVHPIDEHREYRRIGRVGDSGDTVAPDRVDDVAIRCGNV